MNTRSEGLHRGRVSPSTLVVLVLAVAATLLAALLVAHDAAPVSAAAATITVNTPTDGDVRDSVLTLHEAIKLATGTLSVGSLTSLECDQVSSRTYTPPCIITDSIGAGSADTIVFSVATVTLTGTLPALSTGGDTINGASAVTVDGVTQAFDCFVISGESSDANIIKGLEVKGCFSAVLVQSGADNNTIGGTTAAERNVLSGNMRGVFLTSSGTTGNEVQGNYIGVNAAGSGTQPNSAGVLIWIGPTGNTIGGTGAGAGNVISGNTGNGIEINGSGGGASGNLIQGNLIGTDVGGTADLGNGLTGIIVSSAGNTIGGSTAAERNVISGNGYGVYLFGIGATGNLVKGNYVGTNAAGTLDLGNTTQGIHVESGAASNTIGGTAAGERNVISGNNGEGVWIKDSGTTGNTVLGNYIGTNATGTAAIANAIDGVRIDLGATSNTVGGTMVGERNVISGNGNTGVRIEGGAEADSECLGSFDNDGDTFPNDGCVQVGATAETGAECSNAIDDDVGDADGRVNDGCPVAGPNAASNSIKGNYIGANAAGTADMGNVVYGVSINRGAQSNTVGGSAAGDGNVISGNDAAAVAISGANSNLVAGNYIGTNAAATSAIANFFGVSVTGGAQNNTIGGTVAGARNVISGNTVHGIYIGVAFSSGNQIQGNYIGTNAAGTAPIANIGVGVSVDSSASGNTIGGSSSGARNVISGNSGGVGITNGAFGNAVQGNYIGTNASGSAGIPNGNGVQIHSGASGNTIGGTAAGLGNVIAFNAADGVCVLDTGTAPTRNSIRGNSIHSNTDLGIDLAPAGDTCEAGIFTPNDLGDGDTGPNNLQNFPVISPATFDGTNTTISGTLNTGSPANAFVDVYATDVADASGYGEGRRFLGTVVPSGGGAWSLVIPGLPAYTLLTATATDNSGTLTVSDDSTSEFSAVYTMSGSPGAGLPSTAIAYKGLASPIGSTYNFFGPGQVPNTSGEVVFWSSLLSGCPSACTQGIFRWLSGTTTKYVATGDAAPGGGTFSDLTDAPVVNAAGDVVFWAATNAPTEGIYHRTSGSVITKLVGVGDAAPGGSTFSSFDPPSGKGIAVMNNLGDVSFWASLFSGGQGVYLRKSDGTLLKAAATGDATPAGGTFSTFLSAANYATVPIVTENQEVAFRGFMTGGPAQGLFLYSQGSGLTKVAATGDTSPVGGTYSTFGRAPSPNDGGQVAFWANLSGSALPACPSVASACGVFVWEDGVTTKAFASGDAATAQTGGLISDLGTASFMNDAGQITAWASISSGLASQAIVRYTDGYLENVAAISNPSAIGGAFSDFIDPTGFPTNPLPNNQGRVVYWGDVSGGSGPEGVFITDAPTIAPEIVTGPVAGATAPGTNGGTFGTAFDLDINGNGSSVFANTVTGGTANAGVFLFFAGSPGAPQTLQDVALQGQTAPGGGSFSTFHPPVNNDIGQIVFRGTTSGGPAEGLYLFFAGSPQPAERLAANGDPVTEGDGTFNTFSDPVINNNNQIAARASVNGGSAGLFLFFAGQPVSSADKLAAVGDTAVNSGGLTYLFFAGTPSLNDFGKVAVRAGLSGGGGEGLYLFFAGQPVSNAQKLARTGEATVPGGGTWQDFGDPVINADGGVVATATYDNGGLKEGLFLFFAGSPVTKLADTTMSTPIGGTYTGFGTDFGGVAASDGLNPIVVFRATTSTSEGLFLFFAGSVYKIVQQGDAIPNTDPVATFNGGPPVFPYLAMNNDTQVVYVANVQPGATQGVFVANLDADSDTVRNYTDNCPASSNLTQVNTDASLASTGASIVGDSLGDACDDDWDNDGFSNTVELGIATNPKDNCPKTTGPGTGGDSWPLDNVVNSVANVTDILSYKGKTPHAVLEPAYPKRLDLDNNNTLNVTDILKFKGKTPASCT